VDDLDGPVFPPLAAPSTVFLLPGGWTCIAFP
jgi:hypothetical protein